MHNDYFELLTILQLIILFSSTAAVLTIIAIVKEVDRERQ